MREGELEASRVECAPFDRDKFLAVVSDARGLTVEKDPSVYLPKLTKLFSDCGVAVVIVRAPKGCPINGAVRWLSPSKALIQLSFRYLSDDIFWFTFFHEAGHILNDPREEVFVDIDYDDDSREHAANVFAKEFLIPPMHARELTTMKSMVTVRTFAKRIGVHTGIVVGRLQHEKIIPYSQMHDLLVRLDWAES